MAIVSTATSQQLNQDLSFKAAGWRTILGGFLFFPPLILASLTIYSDSDPYLYALSRFNILFLPLFIVPIFFIIYVFKHFKRFLVERHDNHNFNTLIKVFITGYIVIGAIEVILSIFFVSYSNFTFMRNIAEELMLLIQFLILFSCFLIFGVAGIIFGTRLIRIHEESFRLLRIYSIISILASSCVLSIILLPVGMVLHLLNNVMLGFLFYEVAETNIEVEFV